MIRKLIAISAHVLAYTPTSIAVAPSTLGKEQDPEYHGFDHGLRARNVSGIIVIRRYLMAE